MCRGRFRQRHLPDHHDDDRRGGERPVEASGPWTGVDTVQVNGSYTLTANVENLELLGWLSHSGRGNELGNAITGSGGANALSGLGGLDRVSGGLGNDTLDDGAGVDRLDGGAGNDSLLGGTEGDAFVFA